LAGEASASRPLDARPLVGEGSAENIAYLHYYLGEDGLIAGSREEGYPGPGYNEYNDIIPFPLADLAAFLEGRGPVSSGNTRGELASVLIILTLAIPAFVRSGGRQWKMGDLFSDTDKGDKQAAA
jgi:hypothetical protein